MRDFNSTAQCREASQKYIHEQLFKIIRRFKLTASNARKLTILFKHAFKREAISKEELGLLIEATKESKLLINLFMKILLISYKLVGQENLRAAFKHHLSGGRVIFCFNHTGVIDPPIINYILDKFIKENFSDAMKDLSITWVAGRRVWETFLLRIFSRCSRMITIFGRKYIEAAKNEGKQEEFSAMTRHNSKALKWMITNEVMLGLFVEGSWYNDGNLHRGDPSAGNVPKIVNKNGKDNTLIVYCYLEDAEKIMPPSGDGGDDFFRFLEVISRGSVTLHIGEPENWNVVVKNIKGEESEMAQLTADYIMRKIAVHAPEHKRGPYKDAA